MGFKEKLSQAIHGTPEERKRKAVLKAKTRAAYLQSYEKARILRAKAEGQRAGKTTTTERIRKGLAILGSELGEISDIASSYDPFGFSPPPRRRRKKKKKKHKR